MAGQQRRVYVPPSAVEPLPYGLLSVVSRLDPPADADNPAAGTEVADKWQNGVEWQPWPCDPLNVAAGGCVTPQPLKAPTSEGLVTRAADPFTVYAWVDCSPAGGFLDRAAEVTRAALTNNEARAVEHEFWTGAGGTQPHLAANAQVLDGTKLLQPAAVNLTPSGPTNVVRGMGLVEGALGDCYGGVGVIHVPSGALPHLRSEGVMAYPKPADTRLLTWSGNRVAVGAGYPGTSPAGAAPAAGTTWVYATGAVFMERSDVTMSTQAREVVGRSRNTTVMIAERTYVFGWDCCLFAAQVALAEPVEGTV